MASKADRQQKPSLRVRIGITFALAAAVGVIALQIARRTSNAAPQHLTLFVSGDSRGYLEPCGCRRDQAGGLSGRATIIEGAPRRQRLTVDVGNLTSGGRPYELMKLRYMMEGMSRIGYNAVNLGRTEAGLDLPALQQLLTAKLPFVSANVCSRKDSKLLTLPFRLVSFGSVTFGITGVASLGATDAGPGVLVKPPLEALAEVIPTLRSQCSYLIVLAYLDADSIRKAADQFPEVDCILGGDVPQSSGALQELNRAASFCVTDRGKVIGKLDLERNGKGYHAVSAQGIKVMGTKLAPNAEMQNLISQYKAELRDKRYELASAEGLERIQSQQSTADEYVGDAACAPCHSSAHKVALTTAHMHAFETLRKKGSEFDPECLKCHTVGYALYSGFVDTVRTPSLANVQCESCHGRGKAHISTMQAKARGSASVESLKLAALRPVTPASCVRCHDVENSENFNYKTFWPKIAHR